MKVDLVIAHVAPDLWRLEWTFRRPVRGVDFGPAVAGYGDRAWRVVTPGIERLASDGREALVGSDSTATFTRLTVEVSRCGEFADGHYVPMVPFTDGGAALDLDVRIRGLGREHVLRPAGDGLNAYVYFGSQAPVETQHIRILADTGAPARLHDELLHTTDAVTRVYAQRLGGDLKVKPLVLVGAAGLAAAEGGSVKGDAVGDEYVVLLRGKALLEPSDRKRAMVERLVAHELVHLWQLQGLPHGFGNREPWLHEGGAEALAVAALGAAGLWTRPA